MKFIYFIKINKNKNKMNFNKLNNYIINHTINKKTIKLFLLSKINFINLKDIYYPLYINQKTNGLYLDYLYDIKDKNEFINKFKKDKNILYCLILNENEKVNSKYIYYLLKSLINDNEFKIENNKKYIELNIISYDKQNILIKFYDNIYKLKNNNEKIILVINLLDCFLN